MVPIRRADEGVRETAGGGAGATVATVRLCFEHAFSVMQSPQYAVENAGALRQDWPRIPLPNSRELLERSAKLGRKVAALFDTEAEVAGVTAGMIRPELRVMGEAARVDGRQWQAEDFRVTAGWGRAGATRVMPGRGRMVERAYSEGERAGILEGISIPRGGDPTLRSAQDGASEVCRSEEEVWACLGETTVDVYLNERAYWRCVPNRVWEYTIGGYQVLKKWLSYREEAVLGRGLRLEEAQELTKIARRIAALCLLGPRLDANYDRVKADAYAWSRGKPRSLDSDAR